MMQASMEKLKQTEPARKKEFYRCHKMSSWQRHQSHLCLMEKEQSHLFRSPNRKERESQSEREPHLDEKEGNQIGSVRRKEWTSQQRKTSFKEERKAEAKRTSLGKAGESISGLSTRKTYPRRSGESSFHFKSGQTCNGKEVWETKAR